MSTTTPTYTVDSILEQLVSIPSVTGNAEASERVVAAAAQMLQPTGMQLKHGQVNGYPYLQASTRQPDTRTLWFVCHLDVVPADSSAFKVTSDAKNYYGRGVFDMKGMAAAALSAFINLPRKEAANVAFLFTTDEETGGKNGVGALANKDFKAGVTYVFDQSDDWVLQEKMKGVLWLEITAKGKTAHGARPWLGKSANEAMLGYLTEFKKWYDKTIPKDHPEKYYTTFNIGTLHGGKATNQVNDEAVATIDVRFVSEDDAAQVVKAAKTLAAKYEGVSVREIMHEPCVNTDTSEFWYKKTEEYMHELGIKPGSGGERFGHGSTDGRYFAPFNIPVISTRPAGGGQHGPEEWVSKRGLDELEQLCAKLMAETAKQH